MVETLSEKQMAAEFFKNSSQFMVEISLTKAADFA